MGKPQEPRIVLTDPPEVPADDTCPRCGAPPERRRISAGFGDPHDVCGRCGYDFPERTL